MIVMGLLLQINQEHWVSTVLWSSCTTTSL